MRSPTPSAIRFVSYTSKEAASWSGSSKTAPQGPRCWIRSAAPALFQRSRFELTARQFAAVADLWSPPASAGDVGTTIARRSTVAFGGSLPERNGARCPNATARPSASTIAPTSGGPRRHARPHPRTLAPQAERGGRLDVARGCVDVTGCPRRSLGDGRGEGKKAGGRSRRPSPWPFAWRRGHQGISGGRWPRHPLGGDHHSRTGAREQTP